MVGRTAVCRYGTLAVSFLCVTAAALPSRAVIIRGGDGSGNNTAPADDPGWANVASVGSASGVYLGDGWVLTAAHVWASGQSGVSLGGTYYAVEPGSVHRLQQPGSGNAVDLSMFRVVDAPPELPKLSISLVAPPTSATILGIGNGRNRTAAETWWDSNWQASSPGDGVTHGFSYAPGKEKRWGQNRLLQSGILGSDGFGDMYMLRTTFSNTGPYEMQAATGDSGGAMFYKNGANWELAGVILAVGSSRAGQPGETAVYGDSTYYADLSRYRDQIQTIMSSPDASSVPEPSSAALLAAFVAGPGLWYGWRRFRRRARAPT